MGVQDSVAAAEVGRVEIVGVACGHGAADRRCADGPQALERAGLLWSLRARGIDARGGDLLAPPAGLSAVEAIAEVGERRARLTEDLVRGERFFAVVGGDHSCAVGTWSGAARALRREGRLGLVWIDAHMDAHVPETSPSGTLHGMPVACLLGVGEPRLTALAAPPPALSPDRLALVGVRSYEREEAALLEGFGVRVFFAEEVARRGLGPVFDEALAIAQADTAGFGVSIDLDVLDPADAPGVGTPAPGGLRAAELVAALRPLAGRPGYLGVEIAEFNPALDRDDLTLGLVRSLLGAGIPAGGIR